MAVGASTRKRSIAMKIKTKIRAGRGCGFDPGF
jgi:hypothetical protein